MKHSLFLTTPILITAVIALAGCQTLAEKMTAEGSAPISGLASINRPMMPIGYSYTTTGTWEKISAPTITTTLESNDNGIPTWKDSLGCKYTQTDFFSPSLEWENCVPYSSGTQQVTTQGTLWPLQVGNSVSYDIVGKDDSNQWQNKRECRVTAEEKITLESTDYDAFKIVCTDKYNQRVFYFSASQDQPIWYKKISNKNGKVRVHWRLSPAST